MLHFAGTTGKYVTLFHRTRHGFAVTLAENLTGFADADQVSSYAVPALNWAIGQGLANGAGGKLLPQANATRAQVAAIIHRFLEG